MYSLPFTARKVKATPQRLEKIYEAAKMGLKGDTLAIAAGMLPVEYRSLCQLDPHAEQAAMQGKADGEYEMSLMLHQSAKGGDAKAQLAILQHVHGWTAKSEVAITGAVEISITAALEAARARVLTVLEDYGSTNQILPQAGTATDDRTMVITDCRQPVRVCDDGVSLGAEGDTA